MAPGRPETPFAPLRRRLLRRGMGPADVSRLIMELEEHAEDIRLELVSQGVPPEDARCQAVERMGSVPDLEREIVWAERQHDVLSRLPAIPVLLLPPLLLLAFVSLALLLARVGGAVFPLLAPDGRIAILAAMAERWAAVAPRFAALAGPVVLCLLLSRWTRGPIWAALACLLFALLGTVVQFTALAPTDGSGFVRLAVGYCIDLPPRAIPLPRLLLSLGAGLGSSLVLAIGRRLTAFAS